MELTPKQQVVDQLARASQLLILTHKHPDGDAIGSLLALKLTLEQLEKKVLVACPSPTPSTLNFLPAISSIVQSVPINNDIIVVVDTRHIAIEKLGYRQDENNHQLQIVITPRQGTLSITDLSVKPASPGFDTIIALDTPDIERLDALYQQQPKLFYERPLVNIDHHPANEQFGKINWIDMVATSTAEMLVALIEALSARISKDPNKPPGLINEDIATCLLTGIIADTSSFQNINTTPKSLTVAAQLIAAGARKHEIIHHLYKTKPLSTLKLWGAVLARVTDEPAERFIWTLARPADFVASGAQEPELAGLIDELLKTTRDRDFVIVFSNQDKKLHGSLRAINQIVDVSAIAKLFGGGGHPAAAAFDVSTETTIDQTIAETIDAIKRFLAAKTLQT